MSDKITDREKSSQLRRQLIVESAALCFIDKGFHQTSVRDIAEHANISLGNLYNHFKNKNALITEIAGLEAAELEQLLQQVGKLSSPITALDKFVELYAPYAALAENLLLGAEIVAEGLRTPELLVGFLQNRQKLNNTIAELVHAIQQQRQATPATPATLPPIEAAVLIIDAIEGLATRCGFSKRAPNKRDIAQLKSLARAICRL